MANLKSRKPQYQDLVRHKTASVDGRVISCYTKLIHDLVKDREEIVDLIDVRLSDDKIVWGSRPEFWDVIEAAEKNMQG